MASLLPTIEKGNSVATYKEKMKQANREAKFTVVCLAATIVVWIALGFGLSGSSIELFHTPLWIIAGCIGTWLFAIAVAVVISKLVMKDCDLDEEDE